MTFILIVKNKKGVVMAADQRFIGSTPDEEGRYPYMDQGIKMVASKSHTIGICLEHHMCLGKGYSLTEILGNYLKQFFPATLAIRNIIEIFSGFPEYFKAQLTEEEKKSLATDINLNNTFLYCVRSKSNGSFEIMSTKVRNLFYLFENNGGIYEWLTKVNLCLISASTNIPDQEIKQGNIVLKKNNNGSLTAYGTHNTGINLPLHLDLMELYSFFPDDKSKSTVTLSQIAFGRAVDRVISMCGFSPLSELHQVVNFSKGQTFIFSSNKATLNQQCPDFIEDKIKDLSLENLIEKTKKAMRTIIKSSPYFGGKSKFIVINNHKKLIHSDLESKASETKLLSIEDSSQIRAILGPSVVGEVGIDTTLLPIVKDDQKSNGSQSQSLKLGSVDEQQLDEMPLSDSELQQIQDMIDESTDDIHHKDHVFKPWLIMVAGGAGAIAVGSLVFLLAQKGGANVERARLCSLAGGLVGGIFGVKTAPKISKIFTSQSSNSVIPRRG